MRATVQNTAEETRSRIRGSCYTYMAIIIIISHNITHYHQNHAVRQGWKTM